MNIKIINGVLYQPDYQFHTGSLEINGESISAVHTVPSTDTSTPFTQILDAAGGYVIPGLIDIHFHGCAGADFCDGTKSTLAKIAAYQASQGITGICPASMTLPEEDLLQIMESAAMYSDKCHDAADLLGIHLEGPFLSRTKCGAQNSDFLQKPDITLFRRLQEKANGMIRIVDVAPEEDIDFAFIRALSRNTLCESSTKSLCGASRSCKISLAHTTADYDTCMAAFAAGASHVTHLFNAMNKFNHRKTGLIGAAYDTPSCDVELICDGIHVAPSAIRMAFQLFTDKRIILVSDSMRATGMPNGEYTLGGQTVKVSGALATLKDGTIAGSVTNLMDCVRHAVSFEIPPESAIRCATANPARSIGVDDCLGYLKPGYIANIVILNSDFSLRHVILHGRIIV